MPSGFGNKLVIAISSRALFNLDESHEIYEKEGLDAYARYQVEHHREETQKHQKQGYSQVVIEHFVRHCVPVRVDPRDLL